MRMLLTGMIMASSATAFAHGNLCKKYSQNTHEMAAIDAVAAHQRYTTAEMCNLPHLVDIEAQPSQVITPEGSVIPHVRVQLHSEEYSCLYMVRNADLAVTSSRCYSTF